MKCRINENPREHANTYLVVLIVMILTGTVLAAYLKMVGNQNAFTMRSQAWNSSIAIVEAGIEEALAHLNKNGTTNANLEEDGWTRVNGVYYKRGWVGDSYYD